MTHWHRRLLTLDSMTLETGIFLSQAIWLWRVRHIRRGAKKAGKTYDEYIAAHPGKILAHSASSETVVDLEACHASSQATMAIPEKCKTKAAEHISSDVKLEEGALKPHYPQVAPVEKDANSR